MFDEQTLRGTRLRPTSHEDTFTARLEPPSEEWPEILDGPSGSGYSSDLNAAVALLDEACLGDTRDRVAIVAQDGQWTYGELLSEVERTSSLLRDLGVLSGNRVLLRGFNNGRLCITWLAVIRIGAVAVTTMPLLKSAELTAMCEISQPSHAIVDHRLLAEWEQVEFEGITVTYGGPDDDSLEMLLTTSRSPSLPHPTLATDTAILAFTSGSTGRPKATMHSHRDLLAIADNYSTEVVSPGPNDIFGGSPPLAFTFGLGALLIFPLRAHARSVLLESASPASLLRAVDEHRITCLFTAPTAYRTMLREMGEHDLSSLRCCVSAGEALPESTWADWKERTGLPLLDGIGSTELLHIFISTRPDRSRPGSVGVPVTGYTAQIVDADMKPVPRNTPGLLAVKGITGCRYLADSRQRIYVRDGWNVTGDIFVQDDDGYFWYVARADDMIVSSGYNIAAPEVEAALLTHPLVSEVAVVGRPDPDRGNIVVAFVVPSEDVTPDQAIENQLKDHVKSILAPYKCPRAVEFVNALPKTASGKIQRFSLRTGS